MPLHPLIHCPNGPRLRSAATDCWQCAICGDWHAGSESPAPSPPRPSAPTYAHGSPFDPTQRLPLPFAPLNDIPIGLDPVTREPPNDLPRAFPIAPTLPAKPILTSRWASKAGPVELKPGPPPPGLPPGFLERFSKPAKPPASE